MRYLSAPRPPTPAALISTAALHQIRRIVGTDRVLTEREDLIAYAYDGTPLLHKLPDAVAMPRSADEVAALVRLANDAGFKIVARGAGSGLSGGSIPTDDCLVLLMTPWNRIVEIDRENLTAWVEPGVVTAHLHAAVEAEGLFYPPDPGSMAVCTLGGNVAENAGGLRGLKYGVTRNYILGLELVTPTGEWMRVGGKVMKDVAGYDLKSLLIGSEGTLGVFTKILVKLLPKPETSRTMLAAFGKLSDSAEAVSAIIAAHIVPSMLEFLDHTTLNCVEDYAKLGLPRAAEAILLIEVDGRASAVEEDMAKVAELCRKHGATAVTVAASNAEAIQLKTARRSAFSALARLRPTTILEDATVPRSELPRMIEFIQRTAKTRDVLIGNFGHAGDGNLHPTCLTDERDKAEIHRAETAFGDIFNEAIRLGGTITGEHGTGLAKRPFLEAQVGPPGIALMRAVKATLDPNDVLNPGKVLLPKVRCEGQARKS